MIKIFLTGMMLSIFTFFGCQSAQERFLDEHVVLYAKTGAFDDFISKAKIKPKEARKLMSNYIKDNELKGLGGEMFFIIDGYYAYTVDIHPKLPGANIRGIWVNANTGEIKEIKDRLFLRAFSKYEAIDYEP